MLMDVLLVGSNSWRIIIDWICLAGKKFVFVRLEGRQMVGKMDDNGVGRVCHFPNGCCQEEKSS